MDLHLTLPGIHLRSLVVVNQAIITLVGKVQILLAWSVGFSNILYGPVWFSPVLYGPVWSHSVPLGPT